MSLGFNGQNFQVPSRTLNRVATVVTSDVPCGTLFLLLCSFSSRQPASTWSACLRGRISPIFVDVVYGLRSGANCRALASGDLEAVWPHCAQADRKFVETLAIIASSHVAEKCRILGRGHSKGWSGRQNKSNRV